MEYPEVDPTDLFRDPKDHRRLMAPLFQYMWPLEQFQCHLPTVNGNF